MENKFYNEDISSFIDGEIKDTKKQNEIKEKIKNNKEVSFEYAIHSLLKKTIKEKVVPSELSVTQKDEILNKITLNDKKSNFLSRSTILQKKQFLAFSTFAVIFIAFALLIINGPLLNNNQPISLEGSQAQNMFTQAVDNYQNIVSGKMPIQILSNNPLEVQRFFRTNGVNYPTNVSLVTNCTLVGGIVTNYNGVNFANHIYKDKEGHYLYILQVDENYFKNNPKLFINTDLYQFLQNGNQYRVYLGNLLTIMTKVNNNICALISNLPEEHLPEKYQLKVANTFYKQPSIY
ncbi:MAG: hypothetical protein COW08_06365 [Ignavibacteriales bacterium CG12_big_fil_rev_8_21_14_0_65_30_8]|nr:MAG: hypothetical protein COW08_06365 [Ignavibacteriales bacterium CG12_big_fil_rev_8_21_14_0_65_30_8]